MSEKVAFRRVRGRIIPIKVHNKSDIKTGVGSIALGTGVGLAAGRGAKMIYNEAVKITRKRGTKLDKLVFKEKALTRFMAAKKINTLGAVAASALVGFGAGKIARGLSSKNKDRNEFIGRSLPLGIGGSAVLIGFHPSRAKTVTIKRLQKIADVLRKVKG